MTRMTFISDSHTRHVALIIPEDTDILCVLGDFTNDGNFFDVRNFVDWFVKQPSRYKILIAGNHELSFDPLCKEYNLNTKELVTKNPEIIYLEHSSIEIEGIKIFGSPYTPRFFDYAFQLERGEYARKMWSDIPSDTQVFLSHGPNHGHRDYIGFNRRPTRYDIIPFDGKIGCKNLTERIAQIPSVILVGSGHHHGGFGVEKENGVTYIGVANCNEKYKIQNPPTIVDFENGKVANVSYGEIKTFK